MQTKSTRGQTLRALRVAQGLTLRETARLSKMDPSHLSRLERDQGSLSLESLHRLSKVLGLRDLERLLKVWATEESA